MLEAPYYDRDEDANRYATGTPVQLCVIHELMPEFHSHEANMIVFGVSVCMEHMLKLVENVGPEAYTLEACLQDAKDNEEGLFRDLFPF